MRFSARFLSQDSATLSHKVKGSLFHSRPQKIIVALFPSILSLTIVSKSKVVLFGGATGDTGKYIITGDTYALDLISNKWTKLEGKFAYCVQFVIL